MDLLLNHIIKRYCITICFLFISIISICQDWNDGKIIFVKGRVLNGVTKESFSQGLITVYLCDSIAIPGEEDSLIFDGELFTPIIEKGMKYFGGEIKIKPSYYMFKVEGYHKNNGNPAAGSYVLAEDYEPVWIKVSHKDLKTAGKDYRLPDAVLNKRKSKQLKEIEVTASVVKFYHKGDTLVYNADAFITADGSMLDALLRQMPGVKLNPGGQITVNNKPVGTLLINGRDLFNGKNTLALENLGAYTVKEIQCYSKEGKMASLLGKDVINDSQLVMDVKLKREYSYGWFANVNAGYGTHNRFLGKLFGMGFTKNLGCSAYMNTNNLSDATPPGKNDGAWSIEKMGLGVTRRYGGGLNYNLSTSESVWELKGSLEAENSKELYHDKTMRQNLLGSSNNFEYSFKSSTHKALSIKTWNKFNYRFDSKANLEGFISFDFSNINTKTNLLSGIFNSERKDISAKYIEDSLLESESENSNTLNLRKQNISNQGHRAFLWIFIESMIKLHGGTNPLSLTLRLNTSNTWRFFHGLNDSFIRYPMEDTSSQANDKINQKPTYSANWTTFATLTKYYPNKNLSIPLKYTFHSLKDKDTYEVFNIGILNLNRSRQNLILNNNHTLQASVIKHTTSIRNSPNLKYQFKVNAVIKFNENNFSIFEYGQQENIHKKFILPSADAEITLSRANPGVSRSSTEITFRTGLDTSSPNYLQMISRPIINPLLIEIGNTNLKPTMAAFAQFQTEYNYQQVTRHDIYISYDHDFRTIIQASEFNETTGLQVIQYVNKTGSWSGNIHYGFSTTFRRNGPFQLSAGIGASRNLGYASVLLENRTFMREDTRHKVDGEFGLSWANKNMRFEWITKADIASDKNGDKINGIINYHTRQYKSTISSFLNLPNNWSLSTDLSLEYRDGYLNTLINRKDWIWNARLSKSIMNGVLTFTIDAYDILQQLTGISYRITSEARTETISNVIPSYVLFHIQYRINKQPKHLPQ
ncbi:MAG: hypothetical protein HDR93_08940 [Bacteroides sp.]|nr:hypothetical protein [Bacteroides sp.]